jgi:Rad3-related DNA helicase
MKVIDLKPDVEMLDVVKRYFPHSSLRRYQADLANNVYEALTGDEKNVVVEAPTGLGKSLQG